GAMKISRFLSLMVNGKANRDILMVDPTKELQTLYDPLEKGHEQALAPGIRLFENCEALSTFMEQMDYSPIALVIRAGEGMKPDRVVELFEKTKKAKAVSILDLSELDFVSYRQWIPQTGPLPDIIISGETLTGHEIPFAAFSMSGKVFLPWSNLQTCLSHISTCSGNRTALAMTRDLLLKEALESEDSGEVRQICEKIAADFKETVSAFSKYVNPGLISLYHLAGLDFDARHAHGAFFKTDINDRSKDILDCAGGGGLSIRGHTPDDIVADVLDRHKPGENYWQQLAKKMHDISGLPHAFPTVSGSSAVEIAIITALLANKEKNRIIVFKGNYAGITLLSLMGTEAENMRLPYLPLYYDVVYIDPFSKKAKDVLENQLKSKQTALVWMEVLQGQKGKALPEELLELIQRHRKEYGYLVGVDEILTGFYRTGPLFSYQGRFDSPDIVTLFKGLTDFTFPMGMTLVSDDVYKRASAFKPDTVAFLEKLYVNQTASHIGLHVLEKIQAMDLENHVKKMAEKLKNGLDEIVALSPFLSSVEGKGLLFRFHYSYRSIFAKLLGKTGEKIIEGVFPLYMARLCREKENLMLYMTGCLPPLNVTEEEMQTILDKLKAVFVDKSRRYKIYLGFPFFVLKTIRTEIKDAKKVLR
ncbi:MAG: aminotransferase class III-fold pyridoxal phosphate-dependent enzyme, partial [bacterium]|nr:aminotransferase class III-fold pyridoxal phosphate-dependent enzyme [bacterium]